MSIKSHVRFIRAEGSYLFPSLKQCCLQRDMLIRALGLVILAYCFYRLWITTPVTVHRGSKPYARIKSGMKVDDYSMNKKSNGEFSDPLPSPSVSAVKNKAYLVELIIYSLCIYMKGPRLISWKLLLFSTEFGEQTFKTVRTHGGKSPAWNLTAIFF